jgi:hypothetical protein
MTGQFCKNDHGDRNEFLHNRDTLLGADICLAA